MKPAFRGAWAAGQRCLIFADAFFEWQDRHARSRPAQWRSAALHS